MSEPCRWLFRGGVGLLVAVFLLVGCQKPVPKPELGDRYNRTAQFHGPDRNPVIVIPGILGSKLHHPPTDTRVWGAFEGGTADPGKTGGARLIALPMKTGVPLSELRDDVVPDGALETVRFSLFGLPLELEAYAQILGTLGAGGYRDDQMAESGAIDYGTDHYTCFQFDYDWRRDNVENARLLHRFIEMHRRIVQENFADDYGGTAEDYDVKFDIVAHSMGGLVSRYMLRYGDQDLPADGSAPEITWAGTEHIDRVVLVGTPSGGAINALTELIKGVKYSPLHNAYTPAILGTMPSIYQLLPRDRHKRVVFEDLADAPSLYDAETWKHFDWGLAGEDQDRSLSRILPGVEDPAERRRIALDHLQKCLDRARQFHAALDIPAELPDGVSLTLYAGDGEPTPDVATINVNGHITNMTRTPGDGTVTRESALFDDRMGGAWTPRLVTPIDWTDINFLFSDHIGLTADPIFADNILHLLLESPHQPSLKP